MVTEELLRYVEYQSGRGVDRNSIKMTLLQNGWSGDDITEAFKIVDTVAGAEQVSQSTSLNNNQSQPVAASQNAANQPSDGQINPTQNSVAGSVQSGQNSNPNAINQSPNASNQPSGAQTSQQMQFNQVQPNQSQPVQGNVSNQSSAFNSQANNQNYQQPAPNQIQSGTNQSQSINPNTANVSTDNNSINSLKYRTAQDWQNNQVPGNQPIASPAQNQSNQSANTGVNPGANSQSASSGQPNGVYLQSTSGSVVSANQPNQTSQTDVTSQAAVQNQPNTGMQPNPVAASPKAALNQNQPNKSGKGKKITLIAMIAIVLMALGLAGYYFLNIRENAPQYGLTEVVDSLNSSDYVVYAADGALPVANESIDSTAPIAISRLNQPKISFSSNGIVAPMANKGGFEVVIDESKFDYVYDGQDSFGRIRALPSDLEDSFENSLDVWFKFSDSNDTRLVQQFFTNNPGDSMQSLGLAITDALTELNGEGLIEMSYNNSYQDEGKKIDEFDFSLDVRQFLSRLDTDASLISSIMSYLDVSDISGQLSIERESMLPKLVQADLSEDATLVIEFSYEYLNQDIVAPSTTSPLSEVILPLQSLTEVSMLNKIRTSLRAVGSNASVYFNEQQSYQGFCDSEVIQATVDNVTSFSGNQPVCNAVSAGFAFQVQIPNEPLFACIDNDLVDTATATALGSATACGQAVPFPKPNVVQSTETTMAELETETSPGSETGDDQFFE